MRYQTAAEETFSITRLSYLLSGFALERLDGSWLELTNQVAWLDVEKGRRAIQISEIPKQSFRSLRFNVGLSPDLNHARPEQFGANHPLNPNLNGLHWAWQGGYIFMALEGMWRGKSGPYDGWSFHLARDTNRACISLAAPIDLAKDTRLEVVFDVSALLGTSNAISFARDGASTHSRHSDPIAAALVANLPEAFRVRSITPSLTSPPVAKPVKPLYLPQQFTPYDFEISATFPIPNLPRDNPLIKERVELGRNLFHEPLLSRDNTISCASCHQSDHAFADPRRYSTGVEGRTGARNAMPLFNLAWKSSFFWDGRAPSLRAQALLPIQDHLEMDEPLTNLVGKLKGNYPALFTGAFGSPEITAEKLGLALEQFLLTLVSFDSKFDRCMKGEAQFTQQERRGFQLFMTENDPRRGQFGADCFHCHGGPLLQSQTFANNGLDEVFRDSGREKVTGNAADRGKFAIPSLRNVALTAPYMHDGRFKTLEEVVEHYSTGVKRSPTLDPNLAKHPVEGIRLSAEDKAALVAFLKTLTDERFLSNQVVEPGPPDVAADVRRRTSAANEASLSKVIDHQSPHSISEFTPTD